MIFSSRVQYEISELQCEYTLALLQAEQAVYSVN